jgi:hypothetical protein
MLHFSPLYKYTLLRSHLRTSFLCCVRGVDRRVPCQGLPVAVRERWVFFAYPSDRSASLRFGFTFVSPSDQVNSGFLSGCFDLSFSAPRRDPCSGAWAVREHASLSSPRPGPLQGGRGVAGAASSLDPGGFPGKGLPGKARKRPATRVPPSQTWHPSQSRIRTVGSGRDKPCRPL